MNNTHLLHSAKYAFVATVLVLALLISGFFTFEPSVGRSQVTDTFEVTQTVSGAISFQTNETAVVMTPSLDGLTGGTSYGTTTAIVKTNNSGGYNMTIMFASTAPMVRNGGGGYISTFQYSTDTASYPSGFAGAGYAQLGFTVNASTTSDVSTVFYTNAGSCGTSVGGSFTSATCWRGASSTNAATPTQLINRSTPTPASGSTSTVQFRITIPNNPSPVVPDGTYTATATLTATDN